MITGLNANRRPQREPMGPRETAHLHAIRQGIEGDDLATFMNLFDRFRTAEIKGQDTYKQWRVMLNDPDGALATTAYLEAIASAPMVTIR